MNNTVLAFFASTLVVTFCTALLSLSGPNASWGLSFLIAQVAAMVSVFALLFITLPLHFILVRFGRVHILWYLLPGLLTGPTFIFGLKPFGDDALSALLSQSLMCAVLGALGAATFWFFAVRRPRLTSHSTGWH